jgi:hypothetical protein
MTLRKMSVTKPLEAKAEPGQNASGSSDPGSKTTESSHSGSPSSSSDTIRAKSSGNQTAAVASEEKARSSESSPVGRSTVGKGTITYYWLLISLKRTSPVGFWMRQGMNTTTTTRKRMPISTRPGKRYTCRRQS